MNIAILIGLVVLGIVFVLLELFFIPGITVASLIGLASFGAAVYYAYLHFGALAGTLTLLIVLVLSGISIWLFFRSKALDKMALTSEIASNVREKEIAVKVGDQGKTLSRLAPMGKVLINGHSYEAKTEGDMIDENCDIEIIAADAYQIIVKQIINP